MAPHTNFRPHAKARKYAWLGTDGTRTRGIALTRNGRILVHMTATEARSTADRLHDLADQLDTIQEDR